MKRLLLSGTLLAGVLLGVAAPAAQTARFKYVGPDNNLVVLAQSGSGRQLAAEALALEVKGNVTITSVSQGLRLDSANVQIETGRGANGKTEMRRGIATGSVHMVKTVKGASGTQTTDIQGSRADMRAAATGNVVNLSGPVTIRSINTEKHETMTATGRSGVATLEPTDRGTKGNGLRAATLTGPVRVTVLQAAQKGGASRLVATGDRMDLRSAGDKSKVILTGNVHLTSTGTNRIGDLTTNSVTILLNAKGEYETFSTGVGA